MAGAETILDLLLHQVHSYEIRYDAGAAGIGGAKSLGGAGGLWMVQAHRARANKKYGGGKEKSNGRCSETGMNRGMVGLARLELATDRL